MPENENPKRSKDNNWVQFVYNINITKLKFLSAMICQKVDSQKKWNFKLAEMNDLCPSFPSINTGNFGILRNRDFDQIKGF